MTRVRVVAGQRVTGGFAALAADKAPGKVPDPMQSAAPPTGGAPGGAWRG
ncbi:hypothetical protein WN982_17520 [Paraburkholderia sp. IMGN_8]